MKHSTLFVSRRNYKVMQLKQLLKSIRHSIRKEIQKNVNQELSHMNINYIHDGLNVQKINDMEKLYDMIVSEIENITNEYKSQNNFTDEQKEHNEKIRQKRKDIVKSLKGKDLSLEDFEQSNLSPKDYIYNNWTKEYKTEKMTEGIRKKTLKR